MSFLNYEFETPVSNKVSVVQYMTFNQGKALELSKIFSISVDMVRLRVRVDFNFFSKWMKDNLEGQSYVRKYWSSFKLNVCRHNWIIEENVVFQGVQSFYLGYSPNSISKPEKRQWLYLEYNPNKIPCDDVFARVVGMFFKVYGVEMVSADVCWDIEESINNLVIDKGRLKNYKYFSYGKNDVTHYLGVGYGRIKVYNKQKEQKLSDDIKWTRVEITLEIKRTFEEMKFYKSKETLPEIFVVGVTDDPTIKALVWAVQNGYPEHELTRSYRVKVKSALAGTLLDINNNQIEDVVKKYVKDLKIMLDLK